MSGELGNTEGMPSQGDEGAQPSPKSPERTPEESDVELDSDARQDEAAKLAQARRYEEALKKMSKKDGLPDLDKLAEPLIVDKKEVPRILGEEEEKEAILMFKQLGREAAEANLVRLNIDPEQRQRMLREIPEATEESSDDPSEADHAAEVGALKEMIEAAQNEVLDAENDIVKTAQEKARHAENDPEFARLDAIDASRTKSAKLLLKQKLENAKGSLEHLMHSTKHWLDAPPQEWAGRGYRFVTTSMIWMFLFVVWEMKTIGMMAKKK